MSGVSLFGGMDVGPWAIMFGAWRLGTPDFILINHMILLFGRCVCLGRRDGRGPDITGLKLFIKGIGAVGR